MATVTPIKPEEPTAEPRPISCNILDWAALDGNDPQRLAQAANTAATLAVLVAKAISLGGDTVGYPDDDLAESVLVDIVRFSAAGSHRLASLLAGRA